MKHMDMRYVWPLIKYIMVITELKNRNINCLSIKMYKEK